MDDDTLDLHAITTDDLKALFGCITGARVAVGDLNFAKRCGTFKARMDRMMWERREGCLERCDCLEDGSDACYQVESHLCLGNITRMQCRNIDHSQPETMLVLHSIDVETKGKCPTCIAGAGPAVVTFQFSEGAAIRIEVDGVDCYLADMGNPVPSDMVMADAGSADMANPAFLPLG